MEVILAQPRGFCAGVIRAIKTVERALQLHGTPVYVLHEIVHNRHVVGDLRDRGAFFVENLDEVPLGAVTIFSAHGVSNAVVEQARRRNLRAIDATCPLVTKVHLQAQRYSRQGMEIIIIGHPGHPEVEGTRGRIDGPVHVLSSVREVEELRVIQPDRLAYVTQTTLSLDDTSHVIDTLKARFPAILGPDNSAILPDSKATAAGIQVQPEQRRLARVRGFPGITAVSRTQNQFELANDGDSTRR